MTRPETLRKIIALQNSVVHAGLETASVMKRAVEELPQLIPRASGAVIEMLEDREMVYAAASGPFERFVGMRLPADASLSGLCVSRNQPLYAADAATDARVDTALMKNLKIGSMICYPLVTDGECVAVCKVASSQPNAFSEDDTEVLSIVASLIAAALQHAKKFNEAQRSSRIDALTGLRNRRAYDEDVFEGIARANRSGQPLSVMMIDLNGFKEVNDSFGHAAGDAVLQAFAAIVEANSRAGDAIYRLGGDEFAILFPNTSPENTVALLRRLESAIGELEVAGVKIAFSSGVAYLKPLDSVASLTERADLRMYDEKRRQHHSNLHLT